MTKYDPFEAIAEGLVDELDRLVAPVFLYSPYNPEHYWTIGIGDSLITLYENHLCYSDNSTRTVFQYEDPGMIEQLLAAVKRSKSYRALKRL